MSFYGVIEQYRDFDFDGYFERVTDEDVRRSIHERNLSHEDLLNLLSPKAADHLEEMAEKVVELSLQYFGRTVLLYTPMYISNYCINKCKYCGYNVENTINRRKLNQEEIKTEAAEIAKEGCRHLILLTGESQVHSPLEYIVESINTIKEYFPSITIEVWPMTVEQYKEVVKAGAEGLTIYQETYDEKEAMELESKIRKQTFDLGDFLNQLRQIKKMGPISQLIGMMPGVDKKMLDSVDMDAGEKRMKRIEAIICSMTEEERQKPQVIGASRKVRIAKGSGTRVQDVNELLKQFEQMKKMMKQFSNPKQAKLLKRMKRLGGKF